jgi:hypothetical protein
MTSSSLTPALQEFIQALLAGILQARNVVGCRWASPETTPALPGAQRYELGLILEASYDLPAFLHGLAAADPVVANILQGAYAAAALGSALVEEASGPPAPMKSSAPPPSGDWDLADDGPFGPAHET